jgi:hypothetical protein
MAHGLRLRGADLVKSAGLGRIYARLGRRQEAMEDLERAPKAGGGGLQDFAFTYFALGDKDRGFELLKRAFDERQLVIFVKFDPRYDSVRTGPRFQALVARLGIPDPKNG